MLLALGCSLRIGEILGLTWDCVDMTEESTANGIAGIYINKELKRCDKSSLDDLKRRGRSMVLFMFPDLKQDAKTSLVLKDPKTASSVRTVFLPGTVLTALREWKVVQEADKELLGAAYKDYNMVLAHHDGRPYEERQIAEKLRKLIQENGLPPVVFHSLRHCSTTVKLQISGGNIKAVQGDTGHAQARMVTDLYAHMNTEDRRRLAQKMDQDFFQVSKQAMPPAISTATATPATDSTAATLPEGYLTGGYFQGEGKCRYTDPALVDQAAMIGKALAASNTPPTAINKMVKTLKTAARQPYAAQQGALKKLVPQVLDLENKKKAPPILRKVVERNQRAVQNEADFAACLGHFKDISIFLASEQD